MNTSSTVSQGVRPSVFLGVLVALAGILGGGLGTALLMVPGIAVIPLLAVVWGVAYAILPGRNEQWPWWIAGQWLSLLLVHAVSFAIQDGAYGASTVLEAAGFALLSATLATFMWMVPVGLVVAHRRFWATKRMVDEAPDTLVESDLIPSGH